MKGMQNVLGTTFNIRVKADAEAEEEAVEGLNVVAEEVDTTVIEIITRGKQLHVSIVIDLAIRFKTVI